MDREDEIDRLLAEVLEQPADSREGYIDARCSHDPEIRDELHRLIREADDRDPFLKPGGAFDGPIWDDLIGDTSALTPGARVGPYEVVGPIGAGGMGEVYRAHDPRLGRDVAVKVLPRSVSESTEALARFEREA